MANNIKQGAQPGKQMPQADQIPKLITHLLRLQPPLQLPPNFTMSPDYSTQTSMEGTF